MPSSYNDGPTSAWNYAVRPAGDRVEGDLKLERRDVSANFTTIIPVRVEFGGGKHGYVFVVNRQDQQTMTFKVPQKPVDVVLAPDHSLLGAVRRD